MLPTICDMAIDIPKLLLGAETLMIMPNCVDVYGISVCI